MNDLDVILSRFKGIADGMAVISEGLVDRPRSRDISSLVEVRHDNMKMAIERPASKQLISITPLEEHSANGRAGNNTYAVAKIGDRTGNPQASIIRPKCVLQNALFSNREF